MMPRREGWANALERLCEQRKTRDYLLPRIPVSSWSWYLKTALSISSLRDMTLVSASAK